MLMTTINTPKLRFPEFKNSGDWKEVELNNLLIESNERNINKKIDNILSVSNDLGFVKQDTYFDKRVASKDTSNYKIVRKGQFAYNPSRINVGSISLLEQYDIGIVSPMYIVIECNKSLYNYFFIYWIQTNSFKKNMHKFLSGGVRSSLPYKNLIQIPIRLPHIKEQTKIANCFSSLDKLIGLEKEKLNKLQEHKKGLMSNLFPNNNEKQPKLRFPEFKNSGDWVEVKLCEILSYERPDKYIINGSIEDTGNIPVLTANKSFILGYTNETAGICKNHPVILFDDFTTDKKYVDFDFKIKSSAIKLLHAKPNNNLKFIYELMQTIKFNPQEHKRYYISYYQNLLIKIPVLQEEQVKIANFLSSLDVEIDNQKLKIEKLEEHKKGLLKRLI